MTDEVSKKPAKEVPIIQDKGAFVHNTGDTYDGWFEAKKKDKSVKMHGPGVYTTAQGDHYYGMWEYDKLGANQEVTIMYGDGSKYYGPFKDWKYVGFGHYQFADDTLIECNFADNWPVGALTLTDPNGHTWLGTADPGFAWFEPVNHYYEMLETVDPTAERRRKKMSRQKLSTNALK